MRVVSGWVGRWLWADTGRGERESAQNLRRVVTHHPQTSTAGLTPISITLAVVGACMLYHSPRRSHTGTPTRRDSISPSWPDCTSWTTSLWFCDVHHIATPHGSIQQTAPIIGRGLLVLSPGGFRDADALLAPCTLPTPPSSCIIIYVPSTSPALTSHQWNLGAGKLPARSTACSKTSIHKATRHPPTQSRNLRKQAR